MVDCRSLPEDELTFCGPVGMNEPAVKVRGEDVLIGPMETMHTVARQFAS